MASIPYQKQAFSGKKGIKQPSASVKPGRKSNHKRGKLLQQTGEALLSEPGSDTEKLSRFLAEMKEDKSGSEE
ncbi:MAG: hypothetical protein NC211_08545 [Alistipes senegalensis]|nr:hypothetical protein [Oxalobacter formigenes]MCM1281855.1 hypothetical protein [Alistipes senegalensis]